MRIYLSLPITGQENKAREKASEVSQMLRSAGREVVNPFDLPCDKPLPEWIDWMCVDLYALYGCDAIYLCEGWQFSKGCRIEASFAKENDKQFMYENK